MPKQEVHLDSVWCQDGVWYVSSLIRSFIKQASTKYPRPYSSDEAACPQDEVSIAQNLTYLFPGHLMKIQKGLCSVLGDDESLYFLSKSRDFTIIDLACGLGTASISALDFIFQIIRLNIIKRQTPLTVSFILHDLENKCTEAAVSHIDILRKMLYKFMRLVRIGNVETCSASISEVLPFLNELRHKTFNLMVMTNAFDQILIHGERALEVNPHCRDPIAYARPCDRPSLLGDLFNQLGVYSNSYFNRALLLQEWRYAPLIPVCLPSKQLQVVRTWMVQETIRPDCDYATMKVRFGYCGFHYGYSDSRLAGHPVPQPLSQMQDLTNCFEETQSTIGTI